MAESNNWFTSTMKEFPFWRDDISQEEYEEERIYYFKEFAKGIEARKKYMPLWRQKLVKNEWSKKKS